ncbi:unnamed protein product [Arabidopsis arenosa]|uniref:Uncharacterized protein n=1 Tax=Arabidopsis arenosa TaxID=38785 RepID=A0A8S2ABX4_ARAAE|nr:unnamed protein product [Arabidopsis arenosa]
MSVFSDQFNGPVRRTEDGLIDMAIYRLDSETGLPYFLSPTLLPTDLYPANVLEEHQTYLPSAPSPDHDDDLVPRSPCITLFPISEPPPPSFILESRRIPIYEKITPLDTGIVTSMIVNSTRDFEARVQYNEVEKKRFSTMIVTLCRFKPPQTPEEVEGDLCAAFDRLSVDDFFKGDMPDWVPEDTLTASDNLQYYEMKESEVEEYKKWLHLYAELAFFTTCGRFLEKVQWAQPFELRKIIVQTREDVESKKWAKAENAIFYIAFKSRGSRRDYNAIIRRTMDGTPEHMSLEVKCFKM